MPRARVSEVAATRPPFLQRFSLAERLIHRSVALLMLTCLATAAVLYEGPLSTYVGHRRVVELIHAWSGFALPAPLLMGMVSAAYRADLRRLNRFTRTDRQWLRAGRLARANVAAGKFNAGQKLNAALSTGAIFVLLGTGILMFDTSLVQLAWRTGATFVHDWVALAVGLLVAGHIYRAVNDPEARRGMRTGKVHRDWARMQHAAWVTDLDDQADTDG